MSKNPCFALAEAGTSVWLDQLSRDLLVQGQIQSLRNEAALTGLTSNPAIFHKAMTSGGAYDARIGELAESVSNTELLYEHLAVEDIRMACDTLHPAWDSTEGVDGYVSLEVSPHLARDAEGTIAAARRLHDWVDRPNLLIKVPGTEECLPAIETLLVEGIGINVTLLFSVTAYEAVARAYIRALSRREEAGKPLHVPSVASFFVSRIDSLVDTLLDEIAQKRASDRKAVVALKGKAAVANARLAYQSFLQIFRGDEFAALAAKGARVQRPLWASTSTKNPSYSDVMYVEPLIGPDTVNTLPMETIHAFLDHGRVEPGTVEQELEEARDLMAGLANLGISFDKVTDQLLEEGIVKFIQPYDQLLASLGGRCRTAGQR